MAGREPKTLDSILVHYNQSVRAKFGVPGAVGEPEEQLRGPLETLIKELALLHGYQPSEVILVGESRLIENNSRPDFAVVVRGATVGFLEVKRPGKGADPRRYKDPHDKKQWERLRSLPNIMYTDGVAFALFHDGELSGKVSEIAKDITGNVSRFQDKIRLQAQVAEFLDWEPIPPYNARHLATTSARLCRYLRSEVEEQMKAKNEALHNLAVTWRTMLFPDASDEAFADGYAQAVTFGLLVAKARGLSLKDLRFVAEQLESTESIIGTALEQLVAEVRKEPALKAAVDMVIRVLDVVDWEDISRSSETSANKIKIAPNALPPRSPNNIDTWLYFYEDFLDVYDRALRRKTGSYYTPPEVVSTMVRWVDDVLHSPEHFDRPKGISDPDVVILDPAVGTGTFILGILRHMARKGGRDGTGKVASDIQGALPRVIAFEKQFGPFAVAQLRILAEVFETTGEAPQTALRLYITDTLGNPYAPELHLPNSYAPITESRRDANEIKKSTPITVVIGNPPYKKDAKGLGGWVEVEVAGTGGLLRDWIPPKEWRLSTHVKHLYNLYVYFWRWASWKVFEHHSESRDKEGVVCFITVAGFLNGLGF